MKDQLVKWGTLGDDFVVTALLLHCIHCILRQRTHMTVDVRL